ncbi:dihydrofolate reductase [Clostridium thermarum]|uniref:dihydrofolate reductase n=1 Tax=Clostridium thermarum TaxID=1716543 RepID=UPI00111EE9BF|nr:dihydrofolate reductase [Clostridium thermarum]
MLSAVAAIGNNNVIGGNNGLLWHLPADLKKFKAITMAGSRTMIMGRKTFESLPGVLPGRKHIVLTNNTDFHVESDNVEVVHSIEEVGPYIQSEEEYFVIGGGQIYKLLMPYTSKMYITRVYGDFVGDTYFPEWDESQWKIIDRVEGVQDEKNRFRHELITYVRKSIKS